MDSVFALAGGPLFQGMVDLVSDPAGFLDRFPHGKDQTRDGRLRPLRQVKAVDRVVSDPVTAAGLTEVRMTLAGMNEHDGHLGLVAVALADHLGGRAELAGRAVDGGGRAKSAQLKFKDGGGMPVGEGDRIQFTEAIAAAQVVAQFRILVTEDAPIPEFEMAGEEGTDAKLGGGTDDG